jgi:hypothetical protein
VQGQKDGGFDGTPGGLDSFDDLTAGEVEVPMMREALLSPRAGADLVSGRGWLGFEGCLLWTGDLGGWVDGFGWMDFYDTISS